MLINSRFCVVLLLILTSSGCARQYFYEIEPATQVSIPGSLAQWPYQEYWTGIVFNGQKIGFTHFRIEADEAHFKIHSRAVLNFRFLGITKEIALQATDVVAADMQLLKFDHQYLVDESRRHIHGERRGNELRLVVEHQHIQEQKSLPITGELYPSSLLALYPAMKGLVVGRNYRFPVFESESLQIADVEQSILAYETSELFEGAAHRVESTLLGQRTQTWINDQALPVFEMSLNGVIISALESEQRAKRYLALGAVNKQENLLNYSLVKSAAIPQPRDTLSLAIELSGIPENFALPSDSSQQCRPEQSAVRCLIRRSEDGKRGLADQQVLQKYLQASITVPARHPIIQRQAEAIVGSRKGERQAIAALLRWMDTHIEKSAIDVFSALDVLEQKRAECQGHSYLYAAMARSLGIPTRVVNGLVYSEIGPGFLYHTWAESWVDGSWRPIDPTFGQPLADATHIKLVEGEDMAALTGLIPLIGRLQARILTMNDQLQEHSPTH